MPPSASPPSSKKRRSDDVSDNEDGESPSVKRQAIEDSNHDDGDGDDRSNDAGASPSAEDGTMTVPDAVSSPRRPINRPGKPPEAGVIKTIYVENFMCHQKLQVDLCRNVNFVNGQNGSGKSAILAAIQICLGAGARRTHRARNLKDLVRKDGGSSNGPNNAKIRVTLLNGGNDGYKHDVYGDTITVERCIALKGGYNGYKLLDENMVEKSRSKKDLHEMLDMLNIQVENPVSVLDQEEAKKFLTGKAEEKYAFFMKATELERVDRTCAATVDTVEELNEAQDKIKDALGPAQEKVDLLKKKWEQHQALEKLEDKVQEMRVKYAWACYNSVQDEYNNAIEAMQEFQEKAAKKQQELTQAEEAANQPSQDEGAQKERMDRLVEEAQQQTALKIELEGQLKQAQIPQKALKRQLEQLHRRKKAAEKSHAAARQRLQEARDQILAQAGSAESEEARRTALLKEAEEELAVARSKVDELKQAVSTSLQSYEELEPHVHDAKAQVQQVEKQLHAVEVTIDSLNQSGDEFAMLGPRVKTVYSEVEKYKKSSKFKGPVVGPIGKFIKIAPGKERFAEIVEIAIGNGTLDRFIVTNNDDRRLMQEIRKKAGCRQDCGLFQVHETTQRFNIPAPPVDGIETVASVLNISDDLVFNCLVDNARIDQRALAEDRKSSERSLLVRDRNTGKDAIRGIINMVFCLPNGDHWTVRGGSLSMVSNEKKVRKTIGVDKTDALQSAQNEAKQLKQELKDLRSKEGRLEQEHTQYQRQWNKAKKALQKNDSQISDLSTKIDEIKAEAEMTTNVTIDTTEYEEDVSQAELEVEKLKDAESKISEEMKNRQPEIDDIQGRLDEVTSRNQKVLDDMKAAQDELTQLLETQSQNIAMIEKKKKKVERYREIISKHQEKIDSVKDEMEDALLKARTLHFTLMKRQEVRDQEEGASPSDATFPKPSQEELQAIEPPKLTKDDKYYEARVDKAKQKVEKERERRKVSNEDPEVAYEKYLRAKTDLSSKTDQVAELESRINELTLDIKERKKRWKAMRNHLVTHCGIKFDEMLNLNKYSGELKFNHDDTTLTLAVQKGVSSSTSDQTKDVKGLSGGERSYTTMCLLLALGETLETPFRILDEFDVFLDAQVRKLTIKSLIHVAKRMEHRQFIFITPQDLSGLKPDPKLKIFKLRPPERHHTVGGPTQQTLNFASRQSSQN